MAQEVLNKIRDAEGDAQAIVNTAQIAARETVRSASEKAETKLAEYAAAAKQLMQETLEQAEKAATAECEAEKSAHAKEIAEKKTAAEKNLKEARKLILGRIL